MVLVVVNKKIKVFIIFAYFELMETQNISKENPTLLILPRNLSHSNRRTLFYYPYVTYCLIPNQVP